MRQISQNISHHAELIKKSVKKHEKKLGNVLNEERMTRDIQRALQKIKNIKDAAKKRTALATLQAKLAPIVQKFAKLSNARKDKLVQLRNALYKHIGTILFPQRHKALTEKAHIAQENIITLPNNEVIIKHNRVAVRAKISEQNNMLVVHSLHVGKFSISAVRISAEMLPHLLDSLTSAAKIADRKLSRKITHIPLHYRRIQRLDFALGKKNYTISGGRVFVVKDGFGLTHTRRLSTIKRRLAALATQLKNSLPKAQRKKLIAE